MKLHLKRFLSCAALFLVISAHIIFVAPVISYAAEAAQTAPAAQGQPGPCPSFVTSGKYCLLTGQVGNFLPEQIDIRGGGLSLYLRKLYQIGVAVATGLALIYITIGGLQYSTTDSVTGSSKGRETITNALVGLLVVLASYVMLNAINPELLKSDLVLKGEVSLSSISGNTQNIQIANPGSGEFSPGSGYLVDSDGNITYNGQPTDYHVDANGNIYDGYDQLVRNADGSPARARSPGSGGSGSIAADSLAGTVFPDSAQHAYLLQQIKDSGILDLPPPADAAKYFPGGQVTAEGYASLMAGIARSESDFNPYTTPYVEKNGNVSLGYFGVSTNDPVATRLGYTTQQSLADPYHNIRAGVQLMKTQVQTTGTITGTANNHYWGPLYRQANQ